MDAGRYHCEVTFRSPAGSGDALNERVTTWTSVLTQFAAIEPLTVREFFAAGQFQAEATHRVRTPYTPDLASMDASWSLLYGSRVFVLVGPPRNVNERNIELELICAEGARTE